MQLGGSCLIIHWPQAGALTVRLSQPERKSCAAEAGLRALHASCVPIKGKSEARVAKDVVKEPPTRTNKELKETGKCAKRFTHRRDVELYVDKTAIKCQALKPEKAMGEGERECGRERRGPQEFAHSRRHVDKGRTLCWQK